MVFCGKPSKGCGECRSRKIRCDQGLPSCSQCAKGNRPCPGYRDELSLMFRDESQQVVRKAKTGSSGRRSTKRAGGASAAGDRPAAANARKAAGSAASKSTSTSTTGPSSGSKGKAAATSKKSPAASESHSSSSPGFSVSSSFGKGEGSSVTESPSIHTTSDFSDFNDIEEVLINGEQLQLQQLACTHWKVQPSWQLTTDEAVNYFLRHNVWPGAIFMMNFELKSPGNPTATPSEQAQMAALVSVGTAMLSRVRRSESLKLQAEQEYGHALKLLTRAFSIEKESRENSTLSAVLLLAIFEVITSRSIKSIEKWTSHIYGAAALLELRGPEHLQSEEGLKLFVQLRFQIIISCLQRGMPVPKSLLECTKIAMYLRPQVDAYCDRLICITGKLANLRAGIIHTKTLTDANEILSAAYSLEAELLAWVAAGPPEFVYTTYECSSLEQWVRMFGNKPFPYNHQYHVYRDLWICHTWNQYRASRMIVCEIILSCLRRLSAASPTMAMTKELQNHCAQIRNVTRELAGDICASAAYHLGVEDSPASASSFTVPTNYCYVGGMLLLWPLTLAGGIEAKGHPLRMWTRECLRLIGHGIGIDQALALIDVLDEEAGVFEGMEETESGVKFRADDASAQNKVLVVTWNV
ncbi:Zn(II)2Cys6 transcription factor [Aspergillus stella-maris]|uniref:Zn(II)2Cys6 transcription factor n=1 Tax=Aspergillus stella-maris TaxID=1810926 RepID=UPI003CCDEAFC